VNDCNYDIGVIQGVIYVRELWWGEVGLDGNFGLYLLVKLIFFSRRYYSLCFEVEEGDFVNLI
jgi:hypothetical protein